MSIHRARQGTYEGTWGISLCLGIAVPSSPDETDVARQTLPFRAESALTPRRGFYADRNTFAGTGEFARVAFDLAGEVSGSLGTALSINVFATTVMAQASHGSAPDIAGRNIANPGR
ncbi:isocitrate/isopropylmalate family dehydrogenase [Streptomyces leeuwenhoekii]|uniref:isocitrate/isopropylmalate family dehydrogenase n=1 Tax=Streptomyces leeuwenhoekii TaxID=1437453 RepID=UPI0036B1FF89